MEEEYGEGNGMTPMGDEPHPGTWYQSIHAGGTIIEGAKDANVLWERIAPRLPESLEGLRVLDAGCAEGFHAIMCRLRGAQVTAIDREPAMYEKACYLAGQLSVEGVSFRCGEILDIPSDEPFDIVLCTGVLHHAENPVLLLRKLASLCRSIMIFECAYDSEGRGLTLILHQYEEGHMGFFPSQPCLYRLLSMAGFRTHLQVIHADENRTLMFCER